MEQTQASCGQGLEEATEFLDAERQSLPRLTGSNMATTQIHKHIITRCPRALREFNRTPQGKFVELIGRSAVYWRGGAWNDSSSFLEDETGFSRELQERLTTQRNNNICTHRTGEEVEALVAFWWKRKDTEGYDWSAKAATTLSKRY